jgi:hypothetical protein
MCGTVSVMRCLSVGSASNLPPGTGGWPETPAAAGCCGARYGRIVTDWLVVRPSAFSSVTV